MEKTPKEGIYTRKNKYGIISYIITYTINGKTYKKKVGTSEEGWNLNKAVKERFARIIGDSIVVEKKTQNILSLNEVAEQYFVSISHKVEYENTRRRYINHIQQYLASKPLDKVTVHDVQKAKARANS